jgi:hypothetical protein
MSATEASNERGVTSETSVGDVFSQIGDDLSESLRREFEQLRAEAGDRARAGARGAGLLTAAGFSGSLAIAAAAFVPLLGLRKLIGPVGTSIVVAAGAGGASAYLAKRGLDEFGVDTEEVVGQAKSAAQQIVTGG